MKISLFWFRRDLRLEDNRALAAAAASGRQVLPLFIFDTSITGKLKKNDARITFIYDTLAELNTFLSASGSSILVEAGEPSVVIKKLTQRFEIEAVYTNRDFEPYGIERDATVNKMLDDKGIAFFTFTDHLIFEPDAVLKKDGAPYTVYTPYSRKWREKLTYSDLAISPPATPVSFLKMQFPFPKLSEVGFTRSNIEVPQLKWEAIKDYGRQRDFPAIGTSLAGPHLRFGTVSIREMVRLALQTDDTFLGELIWREFFIQVLYHFPHSAGSNFKAAYNGIKWLNDEDLFSRWCSGTTGYPLVDAGMKELRQTGYMHNRVRMLTASFLCKHLLIDWRWGEAWFAMHLLDYELASNSGNWQWAAGTGCDAAPWFRVFNPMIQVAKFDPGYDYIRRWITDYDPENYIEPVVEHKYARDRAIEAYRSGIDTINSR